MRPLTNRQAQILELIKVFIKDTGMPPTRAEIAQTLGFKSANAAEEHLKALAKKGAIKMKPGASRGIQLIEEDEPEQLGLPLIGRVAAGEPILAQQHVESHCKIDPLMFKPAADFLLRVNGMSMRDIGIMDGDLLAVHRTQVAENGQVKEFSSIEVDLENESFNIEGLAVGVIRNADWM